VLAGLERQRYSVQVIHEFDPCCFHGHGRHEEIKKYNRWVQSQIEGHFETCPTMGHIHEVGKTPPFLYNAAAIFWLRITTHGDFPRQAGPDARTLAHPSGWQAPTERCFFCI
jgi:hypothetical protein